MAKEYNGSISEEEIAVIGQAMDHYRYECKETAEYMKEHGETAAYKVYSDRIKAIDTLLTKLGI